MQHNNLKDAEKDLSKLVEVDKKNWTSIYLLLKEVEDKALYAGSYNSFTSWVKSFCIAHKVHESVIWNRKKAGKVYETYYNLQQSKGIKVAPIEEAKVSADSLVLLDKINKYDKDTASKLVDKVINKEITKKDLREVYKSIRPATVNNDPHIKTVDPKDEIDIKKITSAKIVSALYNIEWLDAYKKRRYFKSSFEQDKYRTFTEFPCYTGTTRKSRRMDMLIIENITTKEAGEINLHCIEIKVSKGDLINDHKYSEYAEFVDYLYLAIPEDLLEYAIETKFESCGVITINKDNKATIAVPAVKLQPLKKIDTLTNIALKLI